MRPTWSISADGTDVTGKLDDYLVSLTITDASGMDSDTLSLEVADPRAELAVPTLGAKLAVSLGYASTGLTQLGEYLVDAVEIACPPRSLSIRASAADLREDLKERKTKGWEDTTLGDIVTTIAGEHGLTAAVGASLKGETVARADQTNESDIAFLTRLGQRYDALVSVKAGRLVMTARGQGTAVSGTALDALALTPKDVTSWSLSLSEADQAKDVEAQWHDRDSAETRWERSEGTADAKGSTYRLRQTFPDQDAAKTAAKAKRQGLERAKRALRLTLPGSPAYGAEMPLSLSGFAEDLDGRWIATQVTHRLDSGGYVCQIAGEKP
jgi:uncharacterized protein